jgi:hypothetical protein
MTGGREGSGGHAHFRDDLLRGLDAEPWDLREALHRIVVRRQEERHLLIEVAEVRLQQSEFFQRQRQESPIHGMEPGTGLERISQLVRRRPESLVGERRNDGRFGRAVAHGLQHASRAGAEEIRDETGELEMRFFEERFEPVVQLDAIARELIAATHHRPPEPLLRVGHEA